MRLSKTNVILVASWNRISYCYLWYLERMVISLTNPIVNVSPSISPFHGTNNPLSWAVQLHFKTVQLTSVKTHNKIKLKSDKCNWIHQYKYLSTITLANMRLILMDRDIRLWTEWKGNNTSVLTGMPFYISNQVWTFIKGCTLHHTL